MIEPKVGYSGAWGTVVRVLKSSVVVEYVADGRVYQSEMPIDEWAALEAFAGGR